MRIRGAILFCLLAAAPAFAQPPDEQSLIDADTAWCAALAAHDADAFLSTVAEDALFQGAVGPALHGRDGVREGWAAFLTPGGPTLTWIPVRAQLLGAGDIGYTSGRAERHVKNAAGEDTVVRSEYVTVWRKGTDGRWQVVFDGGSAVR